jgi:RNA polymerase sigma-70 factor (ECF subfamily)
VSEADAPASAPRPEGAPSGDATDAALLARAAAGDADAFGTFVARHEAAVYRFARTLTRSRGDADDVLQEAFIAAWRGAGSYAGSGSARSWLLSIARNVWRHQARRRVGEPAGFEPIETLAERAGWGADPATARQLDAAEARELLAAALARLPEVEREVLVLRELEGFSGEEAAAILQLSLPAMKSRLHRARIHLAAALRALDPDDLREETADDEA